jgi:hypothetical protein
MNILWLLALSCAKAAVVLLIIAIKPLRAFRLAAYGLLGVTALWGLGSLFVFALQCSPDRWALGPGDGNTCVDQHLMQIVVRIVDIAIDLAIIVLPGFMMQSVQVSQSKKLMVILLFAVRLAYAPFYLLPSSHANTTYSTPIFTGVSISVLHEYYDAPSASRPAHAVVLSCWTTVSLNVSVITACIPSIKRFLADWAAGMSAATISNPFEFEHSAGKSGSQSDPQGSNLGSKIASRFGLGSKNVTSTSRSWGEGSRGAGPQHEVKIHGRRAQGGAEEADTSDSVKGLTDGVIMHTIDYKVEYEERQGGGGGQGGALYRNRSSSSSIHGAEREHGYEIGRGM